MSSVDSNGIQKTDRRIVREMMPSVLLLKSLMLGQAAYIESHPGLTENLEAEAQVPLQGLDELSISRIASRVDKESNTILHYLDKGVANEEGRILGVSKAILKLADQGKLDPNSVSSIAALGIAMESELENDEVFASNFGSDQVHASTITKLELMGYF